MGRGGEGHAALAGAAAAAGLGGAAGPVAALFFGQLGRLCWAGIALAAALYGILTAALCRCAAETGAVSARAFFQRTLGRRAGRAARGLCGILLAGAGAAMLVRAGRVAALVLPLRHAGLWGAGVALALALGLSGTGTLPGLGGLALAAEVALFSALALDSGEVRVYVRAETTLMLEDRPWAAVALAALYAALAASLGGGAVLRQARAVRRPVRVGLVSGACMAALLLSACAALQRGGRQLLDQAEPGALLAARWGAAGFALYSACAFLSAVSALAAMMASLGEGG